MPTALFESKNLIGDALNIQPALQAWHEEHPDWDIHLLTLDDSTAVLYDGMGVPLKVVFDRLLREYDFEFRFDVGAAFDLGHKKSLHITQAYAEILLGEEKARKVTPVIKYNPGEAEDYEPDLILLSMFSKSCSSNETGKPPNKKLKWDCWQPILTLLRQHGRIGVLGGPEERAGALPLREDEYYTGLPLPTVARILKHARWLVTIDNGLAHLAATQRTPTIEFYPACLGMHWIAPIGNPNLFVVQVDPMVLTPAQAGYIVRRGIDQLIFKRR